MNWTTEELALEWYSVITYIQTHWDFKVFDDVWYLLNSVQMIDMQLTIYISRFNILTFTLRNESLVTEPVLHFSLV